MACIPAFGSPPLPARTCDKQSGTCGSGGQFGIEKIRPGTDEEPLDNLAGEQIRAGSDGRGLGSLSAWSSLRSAPRAPSAWRSATCRSSCQSARTPGQDLARPPVGSNRVEPSSPYDRARFRTRPAPAHQSRQRAALRIRQSAAPGATVSEICITSVDAPQPHPMPRQPALRPRARSSADTNPTIPAHDDDIGFITASLREADCLKIAPPGG